MERLLKDYTPISLSEMNSVSLMNRTDIKFVTTAPVARQLLAQLRNDYFVQEIDGQRVAPYYTVYFDTDNNAMYLQHVTGHATRQKLRIRSYIQSHLNFLEVKTKDNHGRTHKKRVPFDDFNPLHPDYSIAFDGNNARSREYGDFLVSVLRLKSSVLREKLENRFSRITLINKAMTERLTIDFNLRFHNLVSHRRSDIGPVVIIELKRDGRRFSPALAYLRSLHIREMGFSKYIIGAAMTDNRLPANRIKPRLRSIARMSGMQLIPNH